jgi:transposase
VDETSFQKGHEYVTVVSNQESANVLYVADDRKQGSLDGFYSDLNEEQRGEIESVSMDMWAPYIASTQEYVPGSEEKIAFDKFHVAKHLGKAVDKVRRREHKALVEQGCDDLKGTRYLWLRNAEKLSPQRWADLKALRRRTLKTAEAWAVKEMAMSLWGYKTRTWARKAWKQCIQWAKLTNLGPVISVAPETVFVRRSCFTWVGWTFTRHPSSDHEDQSPTQNPEEPSFLGPRGAGIITKRVTEEIGY